MAKRKLEVIIAGDASGLNRALGQVDRFGSSLGGKLKTVGKVAGVGLAAGLGLAAKVGFDAITEAQESAKIGRLTDAVLKSTGGAANVTADQVAGLAEQISNLTGVDDEAIQEGQNLLLTFTKVRNEVGKGNDIFNQATQASVDMAAALGTDVKGASMQLGKALNDPIKGVTALSRAGVSFTQQQKDQIKAMVESGDVLGAQKIILGEMSTQFGGAAEAASDPMQRLGTIVGNLQERIGTALLPIVEQAADWLGENLPRAMDWLAAKWPILRAKAEPVLRAIGSAVMTVADAIGDVVAFVAANWPKVQETWQRVSDAVRATVARVWPGVQQFISTVMLRIRQVITIVTTVVQALWDRFGKTILIYARSTWENIRRVIVAAINIVRGIIKTVTSLISGDWSGVWNGIKQILSGAWEAIKAIVRQGITAAKYLLSLGLDAVKGVFSAAWSGIKALASSALDGIVGYFRDLPGRILGFVGTVASAATSVGRAILNGIVSGVSGAVSAAGDMVGALAGMLKSAWNSVVDTIANAWDATARAINAKIPFSDPVPSGAFLRNNLKIYHQGGIIPGRGETPIMALGGEGVIRPSTVQALSQDLFKTRPAMSGARASGGSTVVVQLHVHGNLIHQNDLDRHLADVITQSFRRGGALGHSIRRVAQGAA